MENLFHWSWKVISHKLCRQSFKRNTGTRGVAGFLSKLHLASQEHLWPGHTRDGWPECLRCGMAAWRRLLNLRFARQRCWGYQQPGAQDCPSGAETRSNVRLPPMFWCFGIPGFGQGHVSWAKATRHHLANGFCPKSIHAVKGLDLVGFLFRCSTQYFSTSFPPSQWRPPCFAAAFSRVLKVMSSCFLPPQVHNRKLKQAAGWFRMIDSKLQSNRYQNSEANIDSLHQTVGSKRPASSARCSQKSAVSKSPFFTLPSIRIPKVRVSARIPSSSCKPKKKQRG